VDSSDDEKFDSKGKRNSDVGRGKSKGRSKECPGCGAMLTLSIRECSYCDYQFTSKSMLVNAQSAAEEAQSIREKFAFEAETVSEIALSLSLLLLLVRFCVFSIMQEEGSRIIQMILGRRPKKSGKRWAATAGK
jgi:hypothetical protein